MHLLVPTYRRYNVMHLLIPNYRFYLYINWVVVTGLKGRFVTTQLSTCTWPPWDVMKEDGPLRNLHHWKTLPLAGAAVNKLGSEGAPHYHAFETTQLGHPWLPRDQRDK